MFLNLDDNYSYFGAQPIDGLPREQWKNSGPAINSALYHLYYDMGRSTEENPRRRVGTVYSSYNYYVEGGIHVPPFVTFKGPYNHIPRHWEPEGFSGVPLVGIGGGTLYVEPGTSPESVLLDWGAVMQGMVFVQPDQSRERPVVRAPVIRQKGRSAVKDCELFGVWDGIAMDEKSEVIGLHGQCINKGIRLDGGDAGHLIERVELNQCWAGQGGAVDYQWANGIFFHVVYCDGSMFNGCGCRGSKIGWLLEPRTIDGVQMLIYIQVNHCGIEVERSTGRGVVCRGQSSYHKADFNHCTLAAENLVVDIEPGSNARVQLFKCDHYGVGKLARVGGGNFRSHYGIVGLSGTPMVEVLAGARAEVKDCVFADDVAVRMTYTDDGSLVQIGNVAKGGVTMDKVFPDEPLPIPTN